MRIKPPRRILSAALCCLVCWGCGPAGSGKVPDLIPVKGKVTYKGKPLTKGTIKFEPEGFGRPAVGHLQADGSYVLTTRSDGDGVVAGDHRVSIAGLEKSLSKDRAIKKFTSPNTSRLTATVDAEHTEFNFNLP